MSTYCISDIHGSLKALKALLSDIDFKYDGSDFLFLLGDYIDWGDESIETVRFVMELSQHPFVTVLMGNHDYMFLWEMLATDCGRIKGRSAPNWLFNNRGIVTWEQYMNLSDEERESIRDFVRRLKISAQVRIGDDWFLLGHASPFLPEKDIPLYELNEKVEEAVWGRMRSGSVNPMEGLYEKFPKHIWEKREYKTFICGHTITSHFVDFKDRPYEIFTGEHFIDIDCGAKCISLRPDKDMVTQDFINQHRLAALRLDDMQVIYCDRKRAGYST